MSKTVVIPQGVIGFEIHSKRKRTPQYRFNTTVEVPVVGEETRGCGAYERLCCLVRVEGKILSVRAPEGYVGGVV